MRSRTPALAYDPPMDSLPGLDHIASDAFLADAERFAHRWDLEWMRYFQIHDDTAYFVSYASRTYPFPTLPEEVTGFSEMDSLRTRLDGTKRHTTLQMHVPGSEIVGQKIFEMGCGVGMLGRVLGHLAREYVGYDYSPFALYAARLLSPPSCTYVSALEPHLLRPHAGTFDSCVTRHFFIHNNFENSLWVLAMMRDLIQEGGVIHADFLRSDDFGDRIRPAKSPLHDHAASAGFVYTEGDLEELAAAVGLEIRSITPVETPPRSFVAFTRDHG